MLRQRYQNPVVGDTIRLRLFTYSSNLMDNVQEIEKIEIFYLDPQAKTEANPDGRTLLDTVYAVETDGTGMYFIDLDVPTPQYVIGKYLDVWHIRFLPEQPLTLITNKFEIFSQLWYTDTLPAVYDFGFDMQPNRIVKGSKKMLRIQIKPIVPQADVLQRYYENLAISSNLFISISQQCGPCAPKEEDLRLVVDESLVELREKVFGYYQLDTTDLDCGLYDVKFKLLFGNSIFISPKFQLLISD